MGMLGSDNLFDVMGVWSAPWLAAGAARGAHRSSANPAERVTKQAGLPMTRWEPGAHLLRIAQ